MQFGVSIVPSTLNTVSGFSDELTVPSLVSLFLCFTPSLFSVLLSRLDKSNFTAAIFITLLLSLQAPLTLDGVNLT